MPRIRPEVRQEVWRLSASGLSQRKIAQKLGLSRGGVASALKLKPISPLPPPPPLEVDEIAQTFDRRINQTIDVLLARYHQMAIDPETSNRDAIAIGRLLGSWSMLSRPDRQVEMAIANFIDSIAEKISHDAFTELSAALDESARPLESSGSRTNPNGSSTATPTQTG